MPLFSCEVTLILTWSSTCFITDSKVAERFLTTDTKLYVSIVTFKKTINWNKYKSKVSTERQNQYLDYLIDPNVEGVNRLFV